MAANSGPMSALFQPFSFRLMVERHESCCYLGERPDRQGPKSRRPSKGLDRCDTFVQCNRRPDAHKLTSTPKTAGVQRVGRFVEKRRDSRSAVRFCAWRTVESLEVHLSAP